MLSPEKQGWADWHLFTKKYIRRILHKMGKQLSNTPKTQNYVTDTEKCELHGAVQDTCKKRRPSF